MTPLFRDTPSCQKVNQINGKSRGVIATKLFDRHRFVVGYVGDLITAKKAKEREADYEKQKKGVFLYFFSYMDKKYCIDATKETSHLGRLINHSKANANLQAKIIPDKATGNTGYMVIYGNTGSLKTNRSRPGAKL